MNTYFVSLNCIFSTTVEADSFEEAAEIASQECPYDVDGYIFVKDMNTQEYGEY